MAPDTFRVDNPQVYEMDPHRHRFEPYSEQNMAMNKMIQAKYLYYAKCAEAEKELYKTWADLIPALKEFDKK